MNTDLNDSLDDIFGAPSGEVRTAAVRAPANYVPRDFTEPCAKCRGTGTWKGRGQCFACKGVGKKTFKTSPETRNAQQASRNERRAATSTENEAMFEAAHPGVLKWLSIASSRFDFAGSMVEAIGKFGDLTEGQMAAVIRCMERDVARGQEYEARAAAAPVISMAKIEECFATVMATGRRRLPILRVSVGERPNVRCFEFSKAGEHSRNPGAIYVKGANGYLGKVTAGRFSCQPACTPQDKADIAAAAADPYAAAIAYGRETSNCSCCGLTLTDPASIERGIGPVCATKWGW
jgi:hypothetical protein